MNSYRWEYSVLARVGDGAWKYVVDPVLRKLAGDELALLQRARGLIQMGICAAFLLIFISVFTNTGRLLNAAGLLFDIAGALRLFLLEEVNVALAGFKTNEYGNLPSVAMRELVMPEASGPFDANSNHMSQFYYAKRGVLLLCAGFTFQLLGGWIG